MQVVLASANPDKAREMTEVLAAAGVQVLPRPEGVPEVEEDGDTLEDNARLKARALVAATGRPSLADDTGLEVVALGGAPGVVSARWAGPGATYADNVAKLLSALDAVTDRRARFRTVALVAFPDGRELSADGTVDGTIAFQSRGEGGFGYDPVFLPDGGAGLSFAEMPPADKHALSHRGRALRAVAELLRNDAGP
ncbi:MAG: RdgB/HAM1 family non-canonical purine NTP pyrophosphatase [Acidimicrobiales bacterium]